LKYFLNNKYYKQSVCHVFRLIILTAQNYKSISKAEIENTILVYLLGKW